MTITFEAGETKELDVALSPELEPEPGILIEEVRIIEGTIVVGNTARVSSLCIEEIPVWI